MVVLPDTQNYSSNYPNIFCDQTDWIVANREKLNIFFVSQLGDIVNDGGKVAAEWQVASSCLARLNGKVPYGIIPGNHDAEIANSPDSGYKTYNTVFSSENFKKYSWYRGNYKGNQNNYEIIEKNNQTFLFLNLEFYPADDVIAWAQSVVKQHPKIFTILTTHDYLPDDAKVRDASGERLWQNLVNKNCSIRLVWSGHYHKVDGENRLESTNLCGDKVEQIVQDYQSRERGGNGLLRIYVFTPAKQKIKVYTYSAETGKLEADADSQFSLPYFSL